MICKKCGEKLGYNSRWEILSESINGMKFLLCNNCVTEGKKTVDTYSAQLREK